MSISYRKRKKAIKRQVTEHYGEGWLRLKMKNNPNQFTKWIFGISILSPDGTRTLYQKAFSRKGTYGATSGGGGKEKIAIHATFPCISTLHFYRTQKRA